MKQTIGEFGEVKSAQMSTEFRDFYSFENLKEMDVMGVGYLKWAPLINKIR